MMTYQFYDQVFLAVAASGILCGLASLLLRSSARIILAFWLENTALQAGIPSFALFFVLCALRMGCGTTFAMMILVAASLSALLGIQQTSIQLWCVWVIYTRFARYVRENMDRLDLADFMLVFSNIYECELMRYGELYRDIFHDLSYSLLLELEA